MVSIPEVPLPSSPANNTDNDSTASASANNSIPLVGFGTASWPLGESGEILKESILTAIELGYRHFDTAAVYQLEQCLGEAVHKPSISDTSNLVASCSSRPSYGAPTCTLPASSLRYEIRFSELFHSLVLMVYQRACLFGSFFFAFSFSHFQLDVFGWGNLGCLEKRSKM